MFVNKTYCDDNYVKVHRNLSKLRECYDGANIEYSADSEFCRNLVGYTEDDHLYYSCEEELTKVMADKGFSQCDKFG